VHARFERVPERHSFAPSYHSGKAVTHRGSIRAVSVWERDQTFFSIARMAKHTNTGPSADSG